MTVLGVHDPTPACAPPGAAAVMAFAGSGKWRQRIPPPSSPSPREIHTVSGSPDKTWSNHLVATSSQSLSS